MTSALFRCFLLGWLLCASAAPAHAAPAPATAQLWAQSPPQGGKKKDPWWKEFLNWVDEYASSKTGMIQIGVLGVLISLYVITRKDGPK